MGLDVTAYPSIGDLVLPMNITGTPEGPQRRAIWDSQPVQQAGDDDSLLLLTVGACCEDFRSRLDGLSEGYYRRTSKAVHCYSRSYGGYGRFRDALSVAVHGVDSSAIYEREENYAGRPFVELLRFADNEGAIGPKTSAKLLADFRDHAPASFARGHEYARDYNAFRLAFEIAAETGVVIFR
jgi:hypothetical protein